MQSYITYYIPVLTVTFKPKWSQKRFLVKSHAQQYHWYDMMQVKVLQAWLKKEVHKPSVRGCQGDEWKYLSPYSQWIYTVYM